MNTVLVSLGVTLIGIGCVLLFVDDGWLAGLFGISGAITIVCSRQLKSKFLLGVLGICSSLAMFVMFFGFFHGVAEAHEVRAWYELDDAHRYFAFLFGGITMMIVVSEVSCWLKGRQDIVRISIGGLIRSSLSRLRRTIPSD